MIKYRNFFLPFIVAPHGKELSQDLKDVIIKLYKEQKSQCEIAKIINKNRIVLLVINYNTITNYILITYHLSNFDHVLGVVSKTRVSGGNRTHNPHGNSLAHYPQDYQGTHRIIYKEGNTNNKSRPGRPTIFNDREKRNYHHKNSNKTQELSPQK